MVVAVVLAQAGLFVANVQSIFFAARGISKVTVFEPALKELASKTTLSWGKTTRVTDICDPPPLVAVNQWVESDQVLVSLDQNQVVGEVKVMLLFPPASPEPPVAPDKFHPEIPAPVISRTSRLETETVEAVIVDGAPKTKAVNKILFTDELPFRVNVLLTVKGPTAREAVLDALPVIVTLAKVHPAAVDSVGLLGLVITKDMPFQFMAPL